MRAHGLPLVAVALVIIATAVMIHLATARWPVQPPPPSSLKDTNIPEIQVQFPAKVYEDYMRTGFANKLP